MSNQNNYPQNLHIEPIENGFIVTEGPRQDYAAANRQWVFGDAHELGEFMEKYYGRIVITTDASGVPTFDRERTKELIDNSKWPAYIFDPANRDAHIKGDWAHFLLTQDSGEFWLHPDPKAMYNLGDEAGEIEEAISDNSDHALDAAAMVVHKYKGAK